MTLTARDLLRLQGVHPDLVKVVQAAAPNFARSANPQQNLFVIVGLRTLAEQEALYAQGRTAPGLIVTWTLKSNHLTGHAVDLGIILNGKYIGGENEAELKIYDTLAETMLAAAASLKIAINWGVGGIQSNGRPKADFDHFQLDPQFYPDATITQGVST